jgi:hypothetical protein
MVTTRVERSGGWAGIAFVIVTLIGAFAPGVPPTPDATPAQIGAYVDGHHLQWLLAAWLIFPGMAFYYWWLVQLRGYLRLAPGTDDGLPAYLFAGGIALGLMAMLVAVDQIVLGFQPSAALDGAAITLLWDVFNGLGVILFVPAAIVALACSHSGRRHGSLPGALVFWGYVTAAGCGLSTLTLFSRTGFTAMAGTGTFLAGLLPFAVWVIWTSIVLIRHPRGGENSH